MIKLIFQAIILIMLGAFLAKKLVANSLESHKVVRKAYAEDANSKGTYGFTVTTGTRYLNLTNANAPDQKFIWKETEIIKSFFSPTNFMFGFSYNDPYKLMLISGMMQTTLYERRNLPSLAINTGYSTLVGRPDIDFKNYVLALNASWGYRAFLIFGGINLNRTITQKSTLSGNASTHQFGIKYRITPLASLTLVKSYENDVSISNDIKFSFGI